MQNLIAFYNTVRSGAKASSLHRFILLFICYACVLVSCSKEEGNKQGPADKNEQETMVVAGTELYYDCEELRKISLTNEEKINRARYYNFFRERKFPVQLIPLYPDVRLQMYPNNYAKFTRIYIGKETVADRKDYVIISVPFKNPADTCCCVEPGSFNDYAIITRLNEPVSNQCKVDVYDVHEKTDSKEKVFQMLKNYSEFMQKKLIGPAAYPQAFTITDSDGIPFNQPPLIPLLPQFKRIIPCYGMQAFTLDTAGNNQQPVAANLLLIPKKESEIRGYTSCCQVPPMGSDSITGASKSGSFK